MFGSSIVGSKVISSHNIVTNSGNTHIYNQCTISGDDAYAIKTAEEKITELRKRMKTILQPVNMEGEAALLKGQRCDGTGDWLLEDGDFIRWLDPVEPCNTLWLRGPAGLGKTYLMSRVVDFIKEKQYMVAYFFINNRNVNPDRRSLRFIGRTLLYQLLDTALRSDQGDVEARLSDFEACLNIVEQIPENNDVPTCFFKEIFDKVGKYLPRAFLVLDGLDECDIPDQNGLLDMVKAFETITFKIILASRIDAGRHLENVDKNNNRNVINKILSTDDTKYDVELFIRNFVESLDVRDFDGHEEAVQRIQGSSNLFLALRYITMDLTQAQINDSEDFDNVLGNTPKGLTEIYHNALKRLRDSTDESRKLQRRIFMWILYAKRPLQFRELAEAVSIQICNETSALRSRPRGRLTFRGLDTLCANLVDLKQQGGSKLQESIVELAHSSVVTSIQQFVWETEPPLPSLDQKPQCTAEIVEIALAYMQRPGDPAQDDKHLGRPFLDYVYKFWILHLFEVQKPSQELRQSLALFLKSPSCYDWWDSPLSQSVNGTIEDRRFLQARFNDWLAKESPQDRELRRQEQFMLTQQEIKVAKYAQAKGDDHVDTFKATSNLTKMYLDRGDWKEGARLGEKLLTRCEQALGEQDLTSLEVASDLASAYKSQGRWNEVCKMQERILCMSNSFYGVNHPNSLIAARNLARTERFLMRLSTAEKRQSAILRTSRLVLDRPDEPHINTLTVMGDLAKTYRALKRFDDAEKLHVQVIEGLTKLRLDTLTAQNDLAATLTFGGKLDDAFKLQSKVVKTLEEVLFKDHEKTLSAKCDLAFIHLFLRQTDEAVKLLQYVVDARTRCLGAGHPLTSFSKTQLATALALNGSLLRAYRTCVSASLHTVWMWNHVSPMEIAKGAVNNIRWAKVKIGSLPAIPIPDIRSFRTFEFDGITVLGEVLVEVMVALAKRHSKITVEYTKDEDNSLEEFDEGSSENENAEG
ncbi:hypothetical protein RUND412_007576 [Rhizina undulata]